MQHFSILCVCVVCVFNSNEFMKAFEINIASYEMKLEILRFLYLLPWKELFWQSLELDATASFGDPAHPMKQSLLSVIYENNQNLEAQYKSGSLENLNRTAMVHICSH